jgi:hypothetical protein
VKRFCDLFIYFSRNNAKVDSENGGNIGNFNYFDYQPTKKEIALVLTLNFCYMFRIGNREIR